MGHNITRHLVLFALFVLVYINYGYPTLKNRWYGTTLKQHSLQDNIMFFPIPVSDEPNIIMSTYNILISLQGFTFNLYLWTERYDVIIIYCLDPMNSIACGTTNKFGHVRQKTYRIRLENILYSNFLHF